MNNHLNLARKWRPKSFDDIIGQELTVRILKNTLYKQLFFPVYLLAGPRGSGKTTTGRVFAAAVNCERLPDFSHNPQGIVLPCQTCASCQAMATGNHPDFIEIDAASHTGVDHARQIIEATSFLPQLGRKKIYLIDEAHMLSKAAFNAFLKVLEEPPMTVLFMMATTDVHKIIDTIKSRCCQLFFDPLTVPRLVEYYGRICDAEGLMYEQEALVRIAHASEGSARDGLNMIERIRLGYEKIDKAALTALLGEADERWVIELLEALAERNVASITALVGKRAAGTSAHAMLKSVCSYMHALIRMQHGVAPTGLMYGSSLQELMPRFSIKQLISYLELFYGAEQQLLKTANPSLLLELVLIKMCEGTIGAAPAMVQPQRAPAVRQHWQEFVARIGAGKDPLLASVMKQGELVEESDTSWHIHFSKELIFFQDMLATTSSTWQSVVHEIVGKAVVVRCSFVEGKKGASPLVPKVVQEREQNFKDAATWKKTHDILQHFPGTVTEVKK